MIIYVVKPGDSVYKISRRYGISQDEIVDANQIANPSKLAIGQAIIIPIDYIQYEVVSGDSLYRIAERYGTSLSRILTANPNIVTPSRIYPGQIIVIPTSSGVSRGIDVNGYAFPSISANTLNRTLPNLTFLSVFSYQIRPDGSLVPIRDNAMISASKNAGTLPMMVITNIGETGGFNSELANTVLADMEVQNILIENISNIIKEEGYAGLDIDFEYVYPSDRENYNNFLRRIANVLKPQGYIIVTALAPKISENQVGLLYEAHDYKVHGEVADHIVIMTYEWGYTYSEARAVAPVDQVERVLRYATSVIPSKKILMGIPNYGYDWTLPYVSGSAARSISNTAAVTLAANRGAAIRFDEKSQSPYFYYYEGSVRHTVWFEDARSIEAKLKLVDKYNLGGVSYWTINSYFNQNWLVLNSMYKVNKY